MDKKAVDRPMPEMTPERELEIIDGQIIGWQNEKKMCEISARTHSNTLKYMRGDEVAKAELKARNKQAERAEHALEELAVMRKEVLAQIAESGSSEPDDGDDY